jgi:hypothetical protein
MTDSLISREVIQKLDERSVEEHIRDHYRDIWRLYQGMFVDVDTGDVSFLGNVTINGIILNNTLTDASYTVLPADDVIFVDTDGGDITIDLPDGVGGKKYKIINTGSSSNTAEINPNGSETLFGDNTNFDIYDGENIDIHYNSTEGWW